MLKKCLIVLAVGLLTYGFHSYSMQNPKIAAVIGEVRSGAIATVDQATIRLNAISPSIKFAEKTAALAEINKIIAARAGGGGVTPPPVQPSGPTEAQRAAAVAAGVRAVIANIPGTTAGISAEAAKKAKTDISNIPNITSAEEASADQRIDSMITKGGGGGAAVGGVSAEADSWVQGSGLEKSISYKALEANNAGDQAKQLLGSAFDAGKALKAAGIENIAAGLADRVGKALVAGAS